MKDLSELATYQRWSSIINISSSAETGHTIHSPH